MNSSVARLAAMFAPCLAVAAALPQSEIERRNANAPEGVFRKGEVVLFIGDSITHGGRGKTLNHYLGHGYAAEIAMRYLGYRPDAGLCFFNRGVSGHGTKDLLKRWDADALHLKFADSEGDWRGPFPDREGELRPGVVSILVGINDYLSKSPERHTTPGEYAANLEELVTRTLAVNPKCRIVICEPFRLPVDTSPDFLAMRKSAKEIAARHKLCFVDFQWLFSEVLLKENPNGKYWFWDKAHPTYAAHMRMADWWLKRVSEFNGALKASSR